MLTKELSKIAVVAFNFLEDICERWFKAIFFN